MVLGFLVDRDGVPVGYRLFPGNTYAGKSVPALLEKFEEKFQIRRLIFVADSGMVRVGGTAGRFFQQISLSVPT